MKRDFVKKFWIVCTPLPALHVMEIRPQWGKTPRVDQLLHRVRTEETGYKIVLLQLDRALSKSKYRCHIRSQFCGPSCIRLGDTRLLSREIFCDTSRQTVVWNTAALKQTLFNFAPVSRRSVTSLKNWDSIYQQPTQWMIYSVSLLSPTASNCALKTVLESPHVSVIRHGVWPLHSPDLLVAMCARYIYICVCVCVCMCVTSAHSRRTKK